MNSLANKVVLITGASNGIGRAAAEQFAALGATLVLTSRNGDKLQALADDLVAKGHPRPLTLAFDIAKEADCAAAVAKALEACGRIDVLINNAGVGIPTPDLSTAPTEAMTEQIETNVYGVFFITREVLAAMKRAGSGHVVMVSSMAGVNGNPVAPLYCTSKFALEGYTQGLKQQCDAWRKDGIRIRVSNVKPGSVDSGYWGDRKVPREKFMTCEEMASVYAWVVTMPEQINVTEVRMESCR
jgi:NAD(P)-dependent dehydrogenase (short-subunit alcohol dehydrogenase family)